MICPPRGSLLVGPLVETQRAMTMVTRRLVASQPREVWPWRRRLRPACRTGRRTCSLVSAAQSGNVEAVKRLLAQGVDPNVTPDVPGRAAAHGGGPPAILARLCLRPTRHADWSR